MVLLASMALGAASCAKENVNKGDNGRPTSMSIRMTFPQPSPTTRATGDTNALDTEAAVKTVDVFVFNDSGAYQSHTALQASDFTATAGSPSDNYTANATIPTTTGKKSVLVGVNLPVATATSLEGQQVGRVSTAIKTLSIQPSTYDIATNGLPMFSSAIASHTMDSDTSTNVVEVQVKRLVAKVTVEKAAGFTQQGMAGTLGALTFAISNQNTKYFLLQGASPYQDPNWSSTSYDEAQFVNPTAADYVAVADAKPADASGYSPLYAMENTSDAKTGQELTRVEVKATFIPNQLVVSYTQGSKAVTETANPNNTPTTFYKVTVTSTGDVVYFNNATDASNYAADMPGTMATYTNGVCYWYFFLNKSGAEPNQWDVLRNEYYQCSVTSVVAPGHSTANLTAAQSAVTPQNDTAMTVNVDVMNWNTPVQDSYVLEP